MTVFAADFRIIRSGDEQNRRPVKIGMCQPGAGAGGSGTKGGQRDADLAAQPRIGGRHEAGAAFVLNKDEVDLSAAKRIQELYIFAAWQSVNAFNARFG